MDWPLAIDRNRQALMQIIAALFALAGLTLPGLSRRSLGEDGRRAITLPRHLVRAILLILRPAESAARRLILILALQKNAGTVCLIPRGNSASLANRLQELSKLSPNFHAPAFALFDTLKSFDPDVIWNADPGAEIRFRSGFGTDLDPASGFRTLPDSQEPVPAAQILQRLAAISHALENLPGQARRLLRWQARRDAALKSRAPFKPVRITPFRPGLPPGWRQRRLHEVDDILKECHRLAVDAMNAPETG